MQNSRYDIAYLVSHYPKVSHSFIRREILELEKRGIKILRLSIRGWDVPVVDPDDLDELKKTVFVLKQGVRGLLLGLVSQFAYSPAKLVAGLRMAIAMSKGADRPLAWHLIYFVEACWIARYLRAQKVRHLHAHFGTNPAEVAAIVSELCEATFSITIHGPEEFDKVHSVHIAEKVKRSSFAVAISSYCRSQIYRVLDRKDWSKVKVVHCGIEDRFYEGAVSEQGSANHLVCIGRLSEQKGQLLLVEAVAELLSEGLDVRLTLVGDGELRPEIEKIVAEQNMTRHISITGWATTKEVREYILSSRAVIMPSFAEGLPVVLMEAMALRRPVLSTFVNGIPELVLDKETGWLFPAGSKSDMKSAIRDCMNSSAEKLQLMGEQSHLRSRQRHSVQIQGELMLRHFANVVDAISSKNTDVVA